MASNAPMKGGQVVGLAGQTEGGGAPIVREYLNAMVVLGLASDERCAMLRQCSSFFAGTQHDHHGSDWNGMPRDPGVGYMHERLKPQGFVPVNSTPHSYRKPDTPAPLARQIVSRFTEMLLGEGRRPSLQVASDEATQDFLEAAFKDADLWDVLAEARDVAGSSRAAAIAVGLTGGWIDAEVLHPANVWVAEWCDDSPGWCPQVVVEQKMVSRTMMIEDPDDSGLPKPKRRRRLQNVDYWETRAWTPESVIYYEDVPVKDVPEDGFPIREEKLHALGCCPVIWYQNTRNTDGPDGAADCEGVWPLLDRVDRLQSQVYKAAIANTDPTIVIKETRHGRRKNSLIQKGSNHIIALSTEGEAKYLEVQGTSVRVGLDAVNALSSEILQTVECVVISPEYAKAYQSGEALQILWRSMESRANRLRVTLGTAIQSLASLLLSMADTYGVANVEQVGTDSDKDGILLPPRRVVAGPAEPDEVDEPAPDTDLPPVGEGIVPPTPIAPPKPKEGPSVTWEAHTPGGPNAYIALEWPPYWTPTAAQIAQMAAAMSTATTQKQVLSSETATRTMSQMLGNDADEEVRRIEEEKSSGFGQVMASMLGGINGEDDDETEDEDEVPLPVVPATPKPADDDDDEPEED